MAEETHIRRNFLRRDRENRCFMTFPNTTEAIKMEACCHAAGPLRRIIKKGAAEQKNGAALQRFFLVLDKKCHDGSF